MWVLTLVLMVSTTPQNRAMTSVVAEYHTKEACETALGGHLARLDTLTYGVKDPQRLVGVLISSCTQKRR